MGKLQVCVCAARNLYDNQVFSLPDPYCRVRLGDKTYKTKVVDNSLNPVWNETFRFQVADESSAQVCVELWNKNIISDNLMGTYSLSVNNMTRGVVQDAWYLLGHSKTNAELHLRVLACDFGKNPQASDLWKVTNDIHNDPALDSGKKPPSGAAPATITCNVNNTPIDPKIGPAVVPGVVMQPQPPPPPEGPGFYQQRPPQPMYYPSSPPPMYYPSSPPPQPAPSYYPQQEQPTYYPYQQQPPYYPYQQQPPPPPPPAGPGYYQPPPPPMYYPSSPPPQPAPSYYPQQQQPMYYPYQQQPLPPPPPAGPGYY